MNHESYDAWKAARSVVEPGGDFTDRVMGRVHDARPSDRDRPRPKPRSKQRTFSPSVVAASVVGCAVIGLLQSAFVVGFLLLNCTEGF